MTAPGTRQPVLGRPRISLASWSSFRQRAEDRSWTPPLLLCGFAASLVYAVAHDMLALALYDGYSSFSQTVSELSSVGAPTRTGALIVEGVSAGLLIPFGLGVWRSARGRRGLRVVGGALVGYALLFPMWLPFPMSARGEIDPGSAWALADVMHVSLGLATILLELTVVGFGAAALGTSFRRYSIATLAAIVLFWGWSLSYSSRIAAAESTPWLGVIERVALGAWLLWLAVLAFVLLRERKSPRLSGRLGREGRRTL